MADSSSAAQSASGSSFSSWAPVIGAGIDAVGGIFGGLFNANQARKNRQFQERMYYQQLADNKALLEDARKYALPSAEIARLKDAGLNPLLYYSQNGASANLTPAQSAQAPHGGQAQMSMHTNFGQAMMQAQLMQAQIRNMNADSEQKETAARLNQANTSNVEYNTLYNRLCQDINIALKHGQLDQLFASTDKLRAEIYNSGQITLQSVLTMMQAREYEVKRFNLDASTIGEQLKQRWQEIATGRIAANAQMKSAFAAMLNAQANWNLSNSQIGQIALNMSQSREMFPLLKENQENVNWSQIQDRFFKGVLISNAQKDGIMKDLDNYFKAHGAGSDTWIYKVAAPFVLPTIKLNDRWFGSPKYIPESIRYNW